MRNPFKKLDRGFFLIAFIVLLFLVGAVVLYILFHSDSVSDLVNRNESFSVLTVVHDGDTDEIVFSNIMFYSPVTQRAGFLDIPKNAGEQQLSISSTTKSNLPSIWKLTIWAALSICSAELKFSSSIRKTFRETTE